MPIVGIVSTFICLYPEKRPGMGQDQNERELDNLTQLIQMIREKPAELLCSALLCSALPDVERTNQVTQIDTIEIGSGGSVGRSVGRSASF